MLDPRTRTVLNRFGMGAKPGEISRVGSDPKGWLSEQIDSKKPPVLEGIFMDDERGRGSWRFHDDKAVTQPKHKAMFLQDHLVRLRRTIGCSNSFLERLALFWSNHFSVSIFEMEQLMTLCVPHENEVARAHTLGRFSDMLKTCCRHKMMLRYLDLFESRGTRSQWAAEHPNRGRPYNENYAREVMELHTIGFGSGYTQDDVVEMSLLLTGWNYKEDGWSGFDPSRHEPGPRRVFGKDFPDAGEEATDLALDWLSTHPKTAARLSRKLAAHFLGDEPPEAAVSAMEKAWLDSGGWLSDVYKALIAFDGAYDPKPAKYKSPFDFVVSAARALDIPAHPGMLEALSDLGQPQFVCQKPTGYGDDEIFWLSPSGVVGRTNAAAQLAAAAPKGPEAAALWEEFCGTSNRQAEKWIRGAVDRPEGLLLMLLSPEFQWR